MSPITNHQSPITPSHLWTVVPVRGIATGKSRLAGVLDPLARARLNRQLLASTLDVIGTWSGDLARCVVVSPCRATLEMAARLGAAVVDEGENAAGVNPAAALGASCARGHGAHGVLILPCDLPYLSTEALDAMSVAADSERHMVIAPDRSGTGTNALLVSAGEPFECRFGEGSYTRHLRLAVERGWRATVCTRPELGFDLDTPEDLARWTETPTEVRRNTG